MNFIFFLQVDGETSAVENVVNTIIDLVYTFVSYGTKLLEYLSNYGIINRK